MNEEDIPKISFTEKGREFEYFLVREYKKGIINSKEISEESKLMQIKLWDDYLKSYEELYQCYQDREKNLLNKIKESWRELEQSPELSLYWGKFLLKKDLKPINLLN